MFFNIILGTAGAVSIYFSRLLNRRILKVWEYYKNDPYSNVDGSWLCLLHLIPRFFRALGLFCWAVCLIVDVCCLARYCLGI